MALDFHIAKNNNEAPYKEASASFELQPHEIIFHRNGLPEGKFPLFRRMENYYKDAKYGLEELQPLIDEINESYGFIAANIFSHVIIELLKDIKKVLTVVGIFVCSGIIDENKSSVISAMEEAGFDIFETATKEEWVAIVGRL